MPLSSWSEFRESEAAVYAAVRRLSRPDGQGGAVIERAAIVAEGDLSLAIEAWIVDNGGRPEAIPSATTRGLHPFRRETPALGGLTSGRYVLPATALGALA